MMDFEQTELELCVELAELSLNDYGTFSVAVTLESSEEKLKEDVFVEVDGSERERGCSARAGVVEVLQHQVGRRVQLQKKVTFYISKGVFKVDDDCALSLLVDVFRKDDVDVKLAASRVLIFQSPGSLPNPGPDKIVKSVKKNILNLTSKLTEEDIALHVGRIIWNYSLKATEVEPTPQPSPEPTPEPIKEPTPEPEDVQKTPTPEPVSKPPPKEPSPQLPPPLTPLAAVEDKPKSAPKVQVKKKLLPKKKGSQKYRRQIVSQLGKEEVIVHVHAASGLPKVSQDSDPPFPYVAGTTKSDEVAGVAPQHNTSIATTATCFPCWGDTVVIEIQEEDSDTEAVVLLVTDLTTKATLVRYSLPVAYLKPFHQYHLDLIQEGVGYETHLYVSVLRRSGRLQLLDALMYSGVEITLCSFAREITNMAEPVMAVVRIVPNYYALRKDTEVNQHFDELHPRPVQCPVQEVDFTASNLKHSNPQISLPLVDNGQSSWQQQLLFCEPRQMASTFTNVSALIIEYYSTISASDSSKWYLSKSLGYSTMLLNKHVFNALRSERGRKGIQVENLSIRESSLETENKHIPAVNLILRLISEEHPSSLLNADYVDDLPKLESFSMEAERVPPPPSPSPEPSPLPQKLPTPPKTPVQEIIPFRDGLTPPPVPLYSNRVVHSPKPKAKKLDIKFYDNVFDDINTTSEV